MAGCQTDIRGIHATLRSVEFSKGLNLRDIRGDIKILVAITFGLRLRVEQWCDDFYASVPATFLSLNVVEIVQSYAQKMLFLPSEYGFSTLR